MKNHKAFTLIELMIVIAIIAIIAAIAIPGILSARKSANANAAFANLKSFSTAMTAFQNDDPQQRYPVDQAAFIGTGVAKKYFSQPANNTKNGYMYYYFASADQGKFIYVAFPTTSNNGKKAFIVDESNRIWENDSLNDNVAPQAAGYVAPNTPPTAPDNAGWLLEGPERISWTGTSATWVQKT